MTPLRVVVVMLEAPVPFGHAVARWSSVLLKELVARGHRVTAFAACSKAAEMDEARALFPAPAYDLRLYPFPAGGGPAAKLGTLRRPQSFMFSADFKADLDAELARGFDVLHLEQLWTGWVGLGHRDRALVNVLNLYQIDLGGVRHRGIAARLRHALIGRAQRSLSGRYSRFTTLSERLRGAIRAANPRATVAVVPLGIDAGRYEYIPDARRTTEPVVSVIGSMGWYPTHSAAVRLVSRLWPGIKARVPGARVQLVGWGAKAALREFAHLPDITIEENVPDTKPYFERTGVMLYAPARGSGMKVKILDALGYGVPVVTTSEGVEGLPATDGVHAGVCEDDAGLIDRAVELLGNPARQNAQRRAGRALLESHCGPGPTVDAIEAIYAAMLAGGK